MKKRHELINDDEIAELDADWFKQTRPAHEVLPGIFGAEVAAGMLKPKGGRPKATSHKVPVTIRLNPEVATYFKATGKGWQTKMNEALQEYVNQHK